MNAPSPKESTPGRLPAHIFISYASEDKDEVLRLFHGLIEAGTTHVWMDRPEIDSGDEWKKEIEKGLLGTEVMLAILTPQSVEKDSYWIDWEHSEASRLLTPIIPVMLTTCAVPDHLSHLQYVDFTGKWEDGFLDLVNSIGRLILRAGSSAAKFNYQIPPITRHFIGRETEIQEVFQLIEQSSDNVATGRTTVAIQGMGGTGKTMLAEELVRRLGVRYPGGVAVERRGQNAEGAEVVMQEWAKSILGDYPDPPWSMIDVRSELRKRYGELLVLVNDVDEDDFANVDDLLKALPIDATRLVTTRSESISSLGYEIYQLKDFGRTDGILMLKERLKRKGKEPSGQVLEKLFDAVAGHPLSLELAAGRCKSTTDLPKQVDKLVGRLENGKVESLAVRALGLMDEKMFSVAASLTESLELLQEIDQANGCDWTRRFRALGIFPGHAMMDDAMLAAIWGDGDPEDDVVEDALSGLYSSAMLNRDLDTGYYLNHPVLGSYALGHLSENQDEFRAVWERYVRYVTLMAEEGFKAPPEEWHRMEIYRAHIFQVATELIDAFGKRSDTMDHLAEPEAPDRTPDIPDKAHALETEISIDFAIAVRGFVVCRPETGDRGLACLRLGLACARILFRDEQIARFLGALGQWFEKREPQLSGRYYDHGIAKARELGDRALVATLLSNKGELQRTLSRPEDAIRLLEESLTVHRELEARDMEAATLRSLGETHWRLGNHDQALDLHNSALEIYRSTSNRSGEADLLNKIGSVHFNRGDKESAIELFRQALKIHREVGNRSMEAEDKNDMGVSYAYIGNLDKALPSLVEAVMIHEELGSRRLQAISMCNVVNVHLRRGQEWFEAAHAIADAALQIAREIDDLVVEGWALSWKGLALQKLGRESNQSLELFTEAIAKSRAAKNSRGEAGHLGNLGSLYLELGQGKEALDCFQAAVQIMMKSQLDEAFGGRRLEDFKQLIATIEQESKSSP